MRSVQEHKTQELKTTGEKTSPTTTTYISVNGVETQPDQRCFKKKNTTRSEILCGVQNLIIQITDTDPKQPKKNHKYSLIKN